MIIYNKTIWENNKTPINADNLQKIEDGIEYLFDINREVPEAENLRVQAENTRKANEVARIELEKQRVDAENLRKEKIIEIQTDYDSLKKVIIDENASANLQNQINQTNSQLEQKANKTDISSNMKFMGAKTTTEIFELRGSIGDYYYSTDENIYYMYSSSNEWICIGGGNYFDRTLITYQLNVEGRYLNKNGKFTNISNNKFKTIELPVNPKERFLINATYRDSQRMYSFLDASDNVLSVYPDSQEKLSQTSESKLVTIPENVFKIRVGTYGVGVVIKAPLIDVDYDTVISANKSKNLLEAIINDLEVSTETGKYLNENGLIRNITSNNFEITEINVKKGDVFFISGQYIDKSRLFSLRNINNDVVSVYPNSIEDLPQTIDSNIPITIKCDGVLTVCNYKLNNINFSIKKLTFTTNDGENANSDDNNLICENNILLLNKILCIGDSLTKGAYYSTELKGASIKENYPYYLSKINNVEVTNGGHSGYSPSRWYNEKRNLYDIAAHDTFIIWLGTNLGLTDTLDDDTLSGDYSTYAETETGYYCRIIENIKELRPDANIFLCNIFASSGNTSVTNTVLEKIATKYDLPLFDMNDGTIYNGENHDVLHPFGNNVHFGKVGNITVANKITNYINNYIKDNPAQFEKVYIK